MHAPLKQLQGYELRERIGTGGFGAVYRAYQTTIGRDVAIKVILPDRANQPDFIRRFESEAQLIARLEHPHIVPLHDYWRDPEGAYLVMRWLRGGSLRDALEKGAFEPRAAVLLLDQVAEALAFAHRAQVIHRDIKPGNILLDEDGNAYLSDFGIAKDLNLPTSQTESNVILGSMDYISPEQARSEPVTARTDMYSLGVTLYEIITGQHPFPNVTSIERLYKHINDPLPQITTLNPDIQSAVNQVIQKATAKNPDHRYADVLEFAADFREAVGLNRSPTSPVEVLTLREQEILALIIAGLANKEIAQKLTLTVGTVKWHVNQIYSKLGVRSRVQAIVRARELSLIAKPGEEQPTVVLRTDEFHPTNPYKGLLPFQSADNQDYFGREKLTAKLIRRLAESGDYSRFLAIVGPSGSGKSSLVKAGVIPALWRGELPGSERWFVVEMVPGAHPLDELEVALTRVAANQTGNLNEQLKRDSRGLVRVAGLILPNDGTELVLMIDQFEEAFTLVSDEAERMQFLDLLYTAVTEPRTRVRVIITLRADFYDRPLHYTQFGELVRSRLETIMPLSAEELERAITQPAMRVGVTFEPGLVSTIIGDINYQPGPLPLLQYALTELFEARKGRTLTREAYQGLGGTIGALTKRAEAVYLGLSGAEQALARQIFLRLVTLGEGTEDTRRRVLRSELKALTDDSDQLDEILETFAAYRLFALDTDVGTRSPTVEIAHEALLREWERLRNWLNETRDDIKVQRQLALMTDEWRSANQDASFLAHGVRLAQFEAWSETSRLALNTHERAFLSASLAHRTREAELETERQTRERQLERRSQTFLRGLVAVLALAGIIAAVLAINASSSAAEAQRERDAAQVARATSEANFARAEQQRLYLSANEAIDRGAGGNIGLALALRSLQYGYSPGAEAAIMRASRAGTTMLELTGFGFDIYGVRYSPDGSIIAASSEGGTRIYDAESGTELQFLPEDTAIVWTIDFAPDGGTLVTLANSGTARVYDTATWQETHAFEIELNVWFADFSYDGTRLVIGGDSFIDVRDTATWERVAQYERPIDEDTRLLSVLFGATNVERFIMRQNNRIVIRDASNGDLLCTPLDADVPDDTYTWWSERDPVFMVAPADPIDGAYRGYIYNYETCSLLTTVSEPDYRIWYGEYDPVNDRMVTINSNREVAQWQMSTGYELARFSVPTNSYDLDLSPDGTRLALADIPVARVINLTFPAQPEFITTELANTHFPRFAPDGESIYIGAFGDAGRYTLEPGAPAIQLYEQAIRAFSVSTDGRYLGAALELTNTDEHPLLWIDASTGETVRTFEGFSQLANNTDITRDGRLMASGSFDLTARIWDTATGAVLHVLEGHEGVIPAVSFSPDGTQLATSSSDGTVRVWNTVTGALIRIIEIGAPVPFVSYSPDGTLIGATNGDGFAHLYDAETGEERFRLVGHTDVAWTIRFSPDSSLAVTTGWDSSARIWDTRTGALLRTLTNGTGNDVYYAEFSPDGQTVLTGSEFDHRVALYSVDFNAMIAAMCAQPLLDLSPEQRTQYGITDSDPVCPPL